MSEKRFFKSKFTEHIIDKELDKCYPIRDVDGVDEFVDCLNEQQATISALKEENEQLRKDLKTVIDSYDCERIGYCHKGEYCKKWSLNNDR